MTTDTAAPMPRWLYLALKPVETIAFAVALHALVPAIGALSAAWLAVLLYVGIGLFLWYRRRVWTWFGPGSLTGDALYHTLPSLPAPILLATWPGPAGKAALVVVILVLWWQLDAAEYGPMRDPGYGLRP